MPAKIKYYLGIHGLEGPEVQSFEHTITGPVNPTLIDHIIKLYEVK